MPDDLPPSAPTASGTGLRCPPFDGRRLQRQLSLDAAAGWALLAGLVASLAATAVLPETSQVAANALFIAVLVLWMVLNVRSARSCVNCRTSPPPSTTTRRRQKPSSLWH